MPDLALWDWSKGWHPEKPLVQLQAGELLEATNVIYRETGVPEKRRGFQRVRDSYGVGRVDGLVRYRPALGDPYWVFAWQGGLYALYDNGTVKQITTGLMPGQDYFFEVWRDKLFIANGADGLLMWDGESLRDLTTTPPPPPPQPAGFPIAGTVAEADETSVTDYNHSWASEGVVPGDRVRILSGAGAGQERIVADVDGSTLHLVSGWDTVPEAGDEFEVFVLVKQGSSAPAGGKRVFQHNDRLWIAGTQLEPDRLFYSRLLDELNWNDPQTGIDHVIDISVGDNQPITGISRRDFLMIFKEYSIFYLYGYGPEDWQLERITDELGCIAPRSIASLDGTTIWLSHKGVYMDDGSTFHRIGGPVDGWIKDNLTPEQQRKAVAVLDGLNYILHFPDTPFGPICLVWNGRLENWTLWKLPLTFSVLARRNAYGDEFGWAAASDSQALVWLGDTGGTDDGQPIEMVLRSAQLDPAGPHREYLLRRAASKLEVADGDTATVQIYSDGTPVGKPRAVGDGITFLSMKPGQLAKMLSVAIKIVGTGIGSKVHGVTFDVRLRRVRWA